MRPSTAALCVAFLLATAPAAAAEIAGPAQVVDGNTVVVDGRTVVLWGINAPKEDEVCPAAKGGHWLCGIQASRALQVLIGNKDLRCEPRGQTAGEPVVATCFIGRIDVNQQMVLQGWALPVTEEMPRYSRDARGARATRAGLWRLKIFEPDMIVGRPR